MAYWLLKSEPFKYSWDDFVHEGRTTWDGVRNFQARNNLAQMRRGDLCFFYHSNEGREIVGIAQVVQEAYPDPTAQDPRWVVVDLVPVRPLQRAVALREIREDSLLQNIPLLKQVRLSVMPLTEGEWERIVKMSES